MEMCWRIFSFFNSLLHLKTLAEQRKCKKPREGEKTNMVLIFEIRTDLAVASLVYLISVPGKKMKRKSVGS